MEKKMATRIMLLSIGAEMLRRRAFSLLDLEWLRVHIRRLAANLEKIQALVLDGERKAGSSEFVLSWLKRVADVSSETDFLLDECAYQNLQLKLELKEEQQREKVLNCFLNFSNTIVVRTKLIRKIKGVNSELEKFVCGASIIGLISVEGVVDSSVEREETGETSDSLMKGPFGVGEDLKRVKNSLINNYNDQDLSVITIEGKEGVGKTTLARLVFGDVDVDRKFEKKIWIDVPEKFDIVWILKDMFQKLTNSACDLISREAIIYKLMDILKGHKFLLVLDGVRIKDNLTWASFIRCLGQVGGSMGSKILLTTLERVTFVHQSCPVHVLGDRRSEYSSNLAFSDVRASKTAKLMDVCKKIVSGCGGVPLSVKLMGSLMYSTNDESEWFKLAQDKVWHQVLDVPEEQMFDIMKLCYDQLPSTHLKQCFAYCSMFSKDTVIQKEELIQLWMAQGWLYPSQGSDSTMEDQGAKYLDILLRYSFLQDAKEDEFHKGKCYKMPYLLHNLAMLTSKGFCAILEHIPVEDGFKAEHVTMIKCRLALSKKLRGTFAKLRTLRLVDTVVLGDIFLYTKNLCALTVVNLELEELPGSIGRLKHLKLLDISKTRIVKLPDSITKLYCLQTLRLYDLQELPNNFENLDSLSHFSVESFEDLVRLNFLPPKLQDLIKRLSFKASFKACLSNEFGIEKLASLKHRNRYSSLKIYRLENVKDCEEATKANLKEMKGINFLKLHWSGRRENCYDENVLEGLIPHANIRQIVIENLRVQNFHPGW